MEYLTLTVHEFRKNMKAALDTALEGNIVIIDRMGQRFTLTHLPRGVELAHAGNLETDTAPHTRYAKKDGQVYLMNGIDPISRVDLEKISPLPDGKKTVHIESTPVGENVFHKLATDKVSSSIRPDIKYCPHGYGVGLCKKADCNRKYAK